ncbi:MAG TPA: hypothetical protein VM939_13840 [Gemmatimonadaceae bacterium]|nr:hypothetical protein [Gemmatimonadaceae bacterium]
MLAQHLTPDELAAFLNNAQSAEDRTAAELHLVSCVECRTEMIEGRRAVSTAPAARTVSRPRRLMLPLGLAAAAMLAIVVGRTTTDSDVSPMERDAGTRAAQTSIGIVQPSDEGSIGARDPRLIWRRDRADASYRVTVTDENGRTIVTRTVSDTTLALPTEVINSPGTRFFWYVDAARSDAGSATSGVHAFKIVR